MEKCQTLHIAGFPRLIAAVEIKRFLEGYTGEGTIEALEVKQGKSGSRAYANVRFTDSRYADKIISLANIRLYYGSSYLKAYERDNNFMQNTRKYPHEMDGITLNFGCQISQKRFSVLWKGADVSVKFGAGLKKMYFFLCLGEYEYKIQLSSESIWQMVLYNSRGQTANLLLIQLFGAPRIYKKHNDLLSMYSYYAEPSDDQWVRTTDFTPSSRIGQSSGLCLQLPHSVSLPNFNKYFSYYSVKESPFSLEYGVPYCANQSLVPIVQPPRGLELPYRLLFKVCSLVQTGCLPGMKLDAEFFKWVNPEIYDMKYIEHALEKLYYLKECCYDPIAWLREQYRKYRFSEEQPKPPAICLDDGLVYVHRVQVTPTRVYFSGPEINMSNRVLRKYRRYIDNFLRVSFIDEEWDKMYSTDLSARVAGRTQLYERVLSTLRNGIRIGNKKFEFLAFSSSQLRENSLWMFASTYELDADDIRQWMGDFSSIRNVAKYAARLGQSFGSSTETLSLNQQEVERIPDVEVVTNGTRYIFSDGIGKISSDFAAMVALKCGVSVPSAFQIRYKGYKGVVAVDPTSSKKLSLRQSMLKYQLKDESDNNKLDVLSWSKYQPCFLNRQIITLLSTLGVSDRIFEMKQREAVAQLDAILVDPLKAADALDLMSPGENTNVLKEMLKCGYEPDKEPFLSMMLQTFRSSKLLDLRVKARIFIPQARQMLGCMDETGTLKYGQVFVQISGTERKGLYEEPILKRKVVVAKNPCLHPGDVRVLTAVDVPALHHMVDCVVFPQKGMRPHPNECSGSDLDGDIYFVCWDPDLIPPLQVSPIDYDPAPNTLLDDEVTIEEVEEYFTNYIVNDSLGIISNAHTVFADKGIKMALSNECVELAKLFSIAVDFPKTGIPAEIPPHLRVKEYPDFMEKPDKTTYRSERIIGKLFREVKDVAPHTTSLRSFTKEVSRTSYDHDMVVQGFEEYIDEAFDYKTEYDYKLGNLMEYYGIKTEAEILSGGVMKTSKTFDRRKDAEALGAAVRALRNEARSWFKKGSEFRNAYAMASAWYHVTYDSEYWGCYNVGMSRDHYISFPWCVYDKLVQIKRDKSSLRRLQMRFRRMNV